MKSEGKVPSWTGHKEENGEWERCHLGQENKEGNGRCHLGQGNKERNGE